MGIRDILEKLRDGIVADAALNIYTQANFTKKINIFCGNDVNNPPAKIYSPYVVINDVENVLRGGNRTTYKINFFVGVINEDKTEGTNVVIHEGFVLCEELREEIENAILRLRKYKWKIDIESGTLINNVFPLFTSNFKINIETINSSRS